MTGARRAVSTTRRSPSRSSGALELPRTATMRIESGAASPLCALARRTLESSNSLFYI